MIKWTIIDIYHGKNKYYPKLQKDFESFMLKNINIKGLFYDYYSGGTEGDCIKFGFAENNAFKQNVMRFLAGQNKKKRILNIKETIMNYPIKTGKGVFVDDIKSLAFKLSVQLLPILRANPKKKFRIMLELYHHISNQLGMGYKEEHDIYEAIYNRWHAVLFKDGDKKEKRRFKR